MIVCVYIHTLRHHFKQVIKKKFFGAVHILWNLNLDLPNPGIKPKSPTLAGKFFATESTGKPP